MMTKKLTHLLPAIRPVKTISNSQPKLPQIIMEFNRHIKE